MALKWFHFFLLSFVFPVPIGQVVASTFLHPCHPDGIAHDLDVSSGFSLLRRCLSFLPPQTNVSRKMRRKTPTLEKRRRVRLKKDTQNEDARRPLENKKRENEW
mmetsp:Transcript_7786/g.48294  ORF Transcript_7786/g.48294 Transcript_7786/m.48294 type:complete len:104 (+) Transcript_7786:1512-1823(+)